MKTRGQRLGHRFVAQSAMIALGLIHHGACTGTSVDTSGNAVLVEDAATPGLDAALDASMLDASMLDAALDASMLDASMLDAALDAAPPDASWLDAGLDGGAPDAAGPPDAGMTDASTIDAPIPPDAAGTRTCSFTAGSPVTTYYSTDIQGFFAGESVYVYGQWQGTIGGGMWSVTCLNADCMGAAEPPGKSLSIDSTGVVGGGNWYEEVNWDVCPPSGTIDTGMTWSRSMPASNGGANSIDWEARRDHQVIDVSYDGIASVYIEHYARVAYLFGDATSLAEYPWLLAGTVNATVDVSGDTPVVLSLDLQFTEGSMYVSSM